MVFQSVIPWIWLFYVDLHVNAYIHSWRKISNIMSHCRFVCDAAFTCLEPLALPGHARFLQCQSRIHFLKKMMILWIVGLGHVCQWMKHAALFALGYCYPLHLPLPIMMIGCLKRLKLHQMRHTGGCWMGSNGSSCPGCIRFHCVWRRCSDFTAVFST
jgi:hypothetical protein